jgi:CheY-like chemotaxis protein
MRPCTFASGGYITATQVLIIDDHDISRPACQALLRTEGMNVLADHIANGAILALVSALRPDVAIVDVTPGAYAGFDIARKLCALPAPPTVILTSSADRANFGPELYGYPFLAKADINAEAVSSIAEAGTNAPHSQNT